MRVKVNFRTVKHIERGLNWTRHVKSLGSGPSRTTGKIHRLELQFENLSRSPFREILSDLVQAAPKLQRFRQWARKHPDRWGQLVKTFAGLSGYADKTEHHTTGLLAVMHMSDSQLEKALRDAGLVIDNDTGEPIRELGPARLLESS